MGKILRVERDFFAQTLAESQENLPQDHARVASRAMVRAFCGSFCHVADRFMAAACDVGQGRLDRQQHVGAGTGQS